MSLQNKYSQCLKGNLDIGQRMTMGYIASLRPSVPAITNIHMKKVCDKLFSKSRKKLESLFDHLIFVRCVSKLSSNYSSNGKRQILVNNSHPLEV